MTWKDNDIVLDILEGAAIMTDLEKTPEHKWTLHVCINGSAMGDGSNVCGFRSSNTARSRQNKSWTATEALFLMQARTRGSETARKTLDWHCHPAVSCAFNLTLKTRAMNVISRQKHKQCSIWDSAGAFLTRYSKGSWPVQSYTNWLGQTDFQNECAIHVKENSTKFTSLQKTLKKLKWQAFEFDTLNNLGLSKKFASWVTCYWAQLKLLSCLCIFSCWIMLSWIYILLLSINALLHHTFCC